MARKHKRQRRSESSEGMDADTAWGIVDSLDLPDGAAAAMAGELMGHDPESGGADALLALADAYEDQIPSVSPKPVQCPDCKRSFGYRYSQHQHARRKGHRLV